MAAQPVRNTPQPYPQHPQRQTPDPDQQPPRPRAARPTTPMERRPINDVTQLLTREPCYRCLGRAQINRPQVMCLHPKCTHRGPFSDAEMRSHSRHNWRGTLPCGHSERDYYGESPEIIPCPTCMGSQVGAGYLPRTLTLGEVVAYLLRNGTFLNALLDVIEDVYPDLCGENTAALRAMMSRDLQQVQQSQQRQGRTVGEPYYQSEPSAPTPHLGTEQAREARIDPRETPRFSPRVVTGVTPPENTVRSVGHMLPPVPPVPPVPPDDMPSKF